MHGVRVRRGFGLVELRGFEPLTFSLRRRADTTWAGTANLAGVAGRLLGHRHLVVGEHWEAGDRECHLA